MPIEKHMISFDYRELRDSLSRYGDISAQIKIPKAFEDASIQEVKVLRTQAEIEHARREIGSELDLSSIHKETVIVRYSRVGGILPRKDKAAYLLLRTDFVLEALIETCKATGIRVPASSAKKLTSDDLHISVQYEFSRSDLELE